VPGTDDPVLIIKRHQTLYEEMDRL
jgi:hypothetical protein